MRNLIFVAILTATSAQAGELYSSYLLRPATSPAELLSAIEGGGKLGGVRNSGITTHHWVEGFSRIGMAMTTEQMLVFVRSMKSREISYETTAVFVRLKLTSSGQSVVTTSDADGTHWVRTFKPGEWVLYSRRYCVGVSSLRGQMFRWYPSQRELAEYRARLIAMRRQSKPPPARAKRRKRSLLVEFTEIAEEVSVPAHFVRPLASYLRTQGLHGKNAVDLAAPPGTPVHAAASGVVTDCSDDDSWNRGYGNNVLLEHDGQLLTGYHHLEEVYVKAGERVERGQVIGRVGNSGNVRGKNGGYHLHFEVQGARNPFS